MQLLAHLRSLRNSPTSARDLSQILSPIRLGLWFTFFNIAVAIAFSILFSLVAFANEHPNSFDALFFTAVDLGQMFASALFLTIAIFLTLFIPLRIFGFLIGPRTHRYFDQIVISGISPARYMAGKVILQNLFYLIVLAAAAPYLVLCFTLGGVSIPFVLSSIFTLWLYANLLCFVSLALSIVTYEFVAIPAVIIFFGFAIWIGFLPIPPNPYHLTPSPVFVAPVFQVLLEGENSFSRDLSTIFSFTRGIGLLGTHVLFYAVTVVLISAGLFLYISIGPLNTIRAPLNNFGAVVMPGDSKRKRIFRGYPRLRRKGEIAFFYENRPGRIRAKDLLLRWGLKEAVFLAILVPPIVYIYMWTGLMWGIDFYLTILTIGFFYFPVNTFIFTRDRSTANLRYGRISAATADCALHTLNVGLILIIIFLLPDILDRLSISLTFGRGITGGAAARVAENLFQIGLVAALCGITFFSIAQWLSARFWSHYRAFAIAALIYGAVVGVPIFIYAAAYEGAQFPSTEHHLAASIASISPVVPIGQLLDERAIRLPFSPTPWPFFIFHVVAAAFFFYLGYKTRRRFPPSSPS